MSLPQVSEKLVGLERITRADIFNAPGERVIALGRLLLCSLSTLAIQFEPTEPAQYAADAQTTLMLYLLFADGWDIYNSNGDQRITLSNIEKKIIESDAFVFTPGATLEDMFKAISIFVGFQTLDTNLRGKPTIILNEDASWDPLFAVLTHLNRMGTVRQHHPDFLLTVESADGVEQNPQPSFPRCSR